MSQLIHSFTNTVKHWYIPLIIGILFVVFGLYIFTVPLATYITLAIIFSVSFIVSGLMEAVFAVQNQKSLQGWGWYLVSGLLSLGLGIYLSVYPGVSMSILPFVVGFTLLFRSFQSLGIAFDLKERKFLNWGILAISSVLGIIVSFLLLAHPFFTGMSLVSLTALSFIFVGVSAIVLAFNLKKIKKFPEKITAELKDKINRLQAEIDAIYKQE